MYFWISLKDLASDFENLTFELTPGGTPRTGGTPKGGPRGKSFTHHQDLPLGPPWGYSQCERVPPGVSSKVKFSKSDARSFNDFQKYTYISNFSKIGLYIKDLHQGPLPGGTLGGHPKGS